MVEIIAIVRPNKTAETKQALLDIGKPGFTCVRVSGRGKQAVVRTFMDGSVITTGLNNKRMFIIEAENDDEQLIVDKLMAVNCTGEHGDGRIFTVDLQSSYSVREGKVPRTCARTSCFSCWNSGSGASTSALAPSSTASA